MLVLFVKNTTAQKLKKEIKRSNDRTACCRRERLLHAGSYSGTSLCVIKNNNVTNSVVKLYFSLSHVKLGILSSKVGFLHPGARVLPSGFPYFECICISTHILSLSSV